MRDRAGSPSPGMTVPEDLKWNRPLHELALLSTRLTDHRRLLSDARNRELNGDVFREELCRGLVRQAEDHARKPGANLEE